MNPAGAVVDINKAALTMAPDCPHNKRGVYQKRKVQM
jgi:hypothetical protein